MYVDPNFKTKKDLKFLVENVPDSKVKVWQPGPFGGGPIADGEYSVEGPWYPEPHRWYARVQVKDGKVVKVK
jgi:hypothetical protein